MFIKLKLFSSYTSITTPKLYFELLIMLSVSNECIWLISLLNVSLISYNDLFNPSSS